jgi:ATP-dependent DNA ligase
LLKQKDAPRFPHDGKFSVRSYIGVIGIANLRARQAINAPAVFIHPCQPIVAKQPPTEPGWAHELKHDGYRLQIHVRDGRVRLYTINGNAPAATRAIDGTF